MNARFHPPLQVGERFTQDGSEFEVVRVTPAAAYVRERLSRAKVVTIVESRVDDAGHTVSKERSFTTTAGSGVVAISLHSAVARIKALQ